MAVIAAADRVVGRAGDTLLDAAIVAFALWTLVYDIGLPSGAATGPLIVVWLALCGTSAVIAVALRVSRGRRLGPADAGEPATVDPRWLLAWGGVAVAAAVATVNLRTTSWPGAWLPPVAVVAAGVVVFTRGRASNPRHKAARVAVAEPEAPPYSGSLVAAIIALGTTVAPLFTRWLSTDDVYYVNRAVWVAAHGHIPLRDTIFGNQVLPAMRGQQVPVASVETLQGALAHVFGSAAPTAVYLVSAPIATFLATWALWRLVRAWVSRLALLSFVVALVFVIWSAITLTTVWNLHLVGMWHGKSMLLGVVVPLLFTHLTRWWSSRDLATALLLLAAGAAAVGLSSSGVFVVPLVAVAASLPGVMRRDWRGLLGPAVAMAYPVAAGLAVHFAMTAGGPGNGPARPPEDVFGFVIGTGAVAVVGLAAATVAPHVMSRRVPAEVALGAAVLALVVIAPGMPTLFDDATGAGPVLWRALWVLPVAALVGAAVAVRGPVPVRLLLAAGVVALVVTTGTPPWQSKNPVRFVPSPEWQVDPQALAEARLVARAAPQGALVLAPAPVMQALAQTTVRVYTAASRDVYSWSIDEDPKLRLDRVVLAHWSYALSPPVYLTPDELRQALVALGVDYTCVKPGIRGQILHQAGYGPATYVGDLVCFTTGVQGPVARG